MKTLTVVELEFMRKLWALGEGTPEDMKQSFDTDGRNLTGGSVRKMLGILIDKGFVERTKHGRTYIYRPVVSEEKAKTFLIKDVLNRAFDGSISYMFASFLGNENVKADDLEKIARLIEEYRKETNK